MIKPGQIPPEVVEAVMHCFHTRNSAKAAIAAALNAWPDAVFEWHSRGPGIILPVRQKRSSND